MEQEIKITYKRSIFKSEAGFYIGVLKVLDTCCEELADYKGKNLTFTGYFAELKLEESYIFKGNLVEHPKYGIQFNVSNYDRVKPEGKDGLVEFLSSDLFPGIGENMASKIVTCLGEDCLEQILLNPNCLKRVPKLGQKKINVIYNTLVKYEESHQTIVYLTELGFIMKDALLIYNKYKSDTIRIIENNIYRIPFDIDEINFRKVDLLADKKNIEPDDIGRVKSAIIYIMKELLFKNGDTYLYEEEIYDDLNKYFDFSLNDDRFKEALEELKDEEEIKIDVDRYYTKEYKDAEDTIINKIKVLLDKKIQPDNKIDEGILKLQKINKITYNDDQKKAIKKSLENNITIITGGPGTGKTTIIRAICELYSNLNDEIDADLDIALLAPTGRASKRMSESTGLPACTIHRFLKWNKETGKFAINEFNKMFHHLIIIDEVSMIDLELFANLLKGLTNEIKLVLVGDYNQLPSVGSGQILKDLIDSEMIDTISLDYLYRQSENSYIPELASCIRSGQPTNFKEEKDDFIFLECSSNSIVPNIQKLCIQMINKGYDAKRVQLMAPMYAGINGIDRLNKELQNVFNPRSYEKQELQVGDTLYRENDKVLQLVNMPDDNVFNGDIGYIEKIIPASSSESKRNEIYINYDGEIVKYLQKDFIKFKHGYVISIHKSQGSEFELVILPMCKSYARMLYRKLIYTGITRAKRKLILLGEVDAFLYAIKNNQEQYRKTYLKERLESMYN